MKALVTGVFFICLLLRLGVKETEVRELLCYPEIKNGGF